MRTAITFALLVYAGGGMNMSWWEASWVEDTIIGGITAALLIAAIGLPLSMLTLLIVFFVGS